MMIYKQKNTLEFKFIDMIKQDNLTGIYAFQNPVSRHIKIGYGIVSHRFDKAKTWIPDIVWLADTCPFGYPEEEKTLHRCLEHYRHDREWFRLTPELAFYLWDCFGIRIYTDSFMQNLTEFVNSDIAISNVVGSTMYDPPMCTSEMVIKLVELKYFLKYGQFI